MMFSFLNLWQDLITSAVQPKDSPSYSHLSAIILYIIIPFLTTTGVYWIYGLLMLLLHKNALFGHFGSLYKIQKEKYVSQKEIMKCIRQVLWNQIGVQLPFLFITLPLHQRVFTLDRLSLDHLDSAPTIAYHLIFSIMTTEILFYTSHRLLHYGILYRYIHKQHHEFIAPMGLAAEYAHPVEFLFGNILPIFVGPLLCGAHILTTWFWNMLSIIVTVSHHGGYQLPWLIGGLDPEYHDLHHQRFIVNYGTIGLLDKLLGTLKQASK
eukprot:gb/GECH01013164.1/.p1 GENE.gb/GECH01013164.1/~~gb/GECH01013164.1/.p1  ORF type:complete len:266 (+),score=40.31 gb/GECH01013164.1/:1-798(+)